MMTSVATQWSPNSGAQCPNHGTDASTSLLINRLRAEEWMGLLYGRGENLGCAHRRPATDSRSGYQRLPRPPVGRKHSSSSSSTASASNLLLSFFKESNHKLGRVIFYRDGVSKGQFTRVVIH